MFYRKLHTSLYLRESICSQGHFPKERGRGLGLVLEKECQLIGAQVWAFPLLNQGLFCNSFLWVSRNDKLLESDQLYQPLVKKGNQNSWRPQVLASPGTTDNLGHTMCPCLLATYLWLESGSPKIVFYIPLGQVRVYLTWIVVLILKFLVSEGWSCHLPKDLPDNMVLG